MPARRARSGSRVSFKSKSKSRSGSRASTRGKLTKLADSIGASAQAASLQRKRTRSRSARSQSSARGKRSRAKSVESKRRMMRALQAEAARDGTVPGFGMRRGKGNNYATYYEDDNFNVVERGDPDNIRRFGRNVSRATKKQLGERFRTGYVGDGRYSGSGRYWAGEGGFWGDVWGGAKKLGRRALPLLEQPATAALNSLAPNLGTVAMPLVMSAAGRILGEGDYVFLPDRGVAVEKATGQYATIIHNPEEAGVSSIHPPDVRAPIPLMPTDPNKVAFNNIINSGHANSYSTPVIASVNDETGDVIFSYNEFIDDLKAPDNSSGFATLKTIPLNPGMPKAFPLLSKFASLFGMYDFVQCIFHIKSLVTDSNATAAGSVMMVPVYNPSARPLPDKRTVTGTEGNVTGKVTMDLFCGIECNNNKNAQGALKLTRTVDVNSIGLDMYDMGFLQVACEHVPPGMCIGELWCSYQVRLSKLRIDTEAVTPVGEGISIRNVDVGAPNMANTAPLVVPLSRGTKNVNISETIVVSPMQAAYDAIAGFVNVGGWHAKMAVIGGSTYRIAFGTTLHIRCTGAGPITAYPDRNRAAQFLGGLLPPGHLSLGRVDVNNPVSSIPHVVSVPTYTIGEVTRVSQHDLTSGTFMAYYTVPIMVEALLTLHLPGQVGTFEADYLFGIANTLFTNPGQGAASHTVTSTWSGGPFSPALNSTEVFIPVSEAVTTSLIRIT